MTEPSEQNERLEFAIMLASEAHAGQPYAPHGDEPEPYILHPLRVMTMVDPEFRVVAVLHDVLEDSSVDVEAEVDITPAEREALALLTRRPSLPYHAYIERIGFAQGRAGVIARAVKIADLSDNLAHDPPDSLRERYEAALAVLRTFP